MILSVSRRTDIPAFYATWFLHRVRAGFCVVPNPFRPAQVSRVSLEPQDVDAFVFWSKNPAPLLPHLAELEARGYRYYFQFTLNGYDRRFEPHMPALPERIATFRALARQTAPWRVVWRYDPILLSTWTPADFHRETFRRLADQLAGSTTCVVVSLVDFYAKTRRRLAALERQGNTVTRTPEQAPEAHVLLRDLAGIARQHGMTIQTCAEGTDFREIGVPAGACIDPTILARLGRPLSLPKDPGQRPLCLCVTSRDIGMTDTCLHDCVYCYATQHPVLARQRHERHDLAFPRLIPPDRG